MKKNLYVAVCILFVAVVSGCGKSQPVSTPETAAETESVVTAETEESVIETETISEVETPIMEVETEPVVTEVETESVATEDGTETVELAETESETVLPESEAATVEEVAISEMDAQMYAQANVNIRASYSKDSEKLGVLQRGTSVHVTGLTEDEKWFRVEDASNGERYVSAAYLGSEKPKEEQQTPAQAQGGGEGESREYTDAEIQAMLDAADAAMAAKGMDVNAHVNLPNSEPFDDEVPPELAGLQWY